MGGDAGQDRTLPGCQRRGPDQLVNPERIILGGRADLLLGEYMLPAIRAAAHGRSLRHLFAETSIELGRLGPDAVALGAATLPIEAFLGGNVFTTREVAQRAG